MPDTGECFRLCDCQERLVPALAALSPIATLLIVAPITIYLFVVRGKGIARWDGGRFHGSIGIVNFPGK